MADAGAAAAPIPPEDSSSSAEGGGEDAAASPTLTVNIKTLNGPDFELLVGRDEPVSEMKTKVREHTNVDEVGTKRAVRGVVQVERGGNITYVKGWAARVGLRDVGSCRCFFLFFGVEKFLAREMVPGHPADILPQMLVLRAYHRAFNRRRMQSILFTYNMGKASNQCDFTRTVYQQTAALPATEPPPPSWASMHGFWLLRMLGDFDSSAQSSNIVHLTQQQQPLASPHALLCALPFVLSKQSRPRKHMPGRVA